MYIIKPIHRYTAVFPKIRAIPFSSNKSTPTNPIKGDATDMIRVTIIIGLYLYIKRCLFVQKVKTVLINISTIIARTSIDGNSNKSFQNTGAMMYIIKVINVKTETIPWIEDMYLSRSFSNLIIAVSNDPYCKFKVAKIATIFIHD